MMQPMFELYDPSEDSSIKIYDNGKVECDNDLKYSCVTNRIPIKEVEVWNEAIERAATICADKISRDAVRMLKK